MTDTLDYITRIRGYYKALGYGKSYEWARVDDVPFTPMSMNLPNARVGIVSTAAPFVPGAGDQGAWAVHNGRAKYPRTYALPSDPAPDLRISHIAYDRVHTSAADVGTFFPLAALQQLAALGEIGSVGPRVYGVPTTYSQATTWGRDTDDLIAFAKEDQIDVAVLVANCPVCHQTMVISANRLETAGIPTVVMGCALDIVEHVGTPRFLFSNLPLGNAGGLPDDQASQLETARLAVNLLETAGVSRTTQRSPYEWSGAGDWQKDYSNPDLLSAEELAARKAAFDQMKADGKAVKAKA